MAISNSQAVQSDSGTFDAATLLKYVTIGVDSEKLNEVFKRDEAEQDEAMAGVLDTLNKLLTDASLYVGMANPFYGGQLWLLTEHDVPAQEESAPQGILATLLKFIKTFCLIFSKISL